MVTAMIVRTLIINGNSNYCYNTDAIKKNSASVQLFDGLGPGKIENENRKW